MAPNSLTARAHVTTPAASRPRALRGNVTRHQVVQAESPNVRAAFSRRTGTRTIDSRAALTNNGALTNSMAQMIPSGVPTMRNPSCSSTWPTSLLRPNTSSRAIPATGCGSTSGRSSSAARSARPRNRRRANSQASGVPPRAASNVADVAVPTVSSSELRSSASVNSSDRPRAPEPPMSAPTGSANRRSRQDAATAASIPETGGTALNISTTTLMDAAAISWFPVVVPCPSTPSA